MNEKNLDHDVLNCLLEFDESLRSGRLAETQVVINNEELLRSLELGQAALLELEAAIPRRTSIMPSWAPQQIDRFQIQSVLGAGGFAVVYLAFDPTLNRQVALKIPRPHALIRPELRRRFVTEAQAAAKLDHPNIVSVYDAGEDRDLPFIACAYCDGPTLAEWLSSKTAPMQPKVAATIVRDLARAIQYSHDRGILHRDIKPGNVLLFPAVHADEAFPFIPRISDFGLAKVLESNALDSVTSQLIGTPRYMAPEVLKGTGQPGDISPDVYALGALLYCLVVGQAPFGSATTAETLRKIIESDPIPPDTIDPAVGRDLSLVCMKCLQKLPHQRYPSASALAEDLDRYLSGRPILARETPPVLRIAKWCRRRPLVASLIAVTASLAIVLIALAIRHTTAMQRLQSQLEGANQQLSIRVSELDTAVRAADQNKTEAETNRLIADEQVFAADLKLADSLRQSGDIRAATSLLDRYASQQESTSSIRGQESFAWRYLKAKTTRDGRELPDAGQTVWDLEFSPQGDRLALCGNQGIVRILDVHDNFRTILERKLAETEFNSIAWCDTEPILATCADDGLVRIYSSEDLNHLRTLDAFPGKHAYGLAFLPGTSRVYVGGDSTELQAWDALTGQLFQKIETPHTRGIENLVTSSDGQQIVTGGFGGNLCVWRAADHTSLWQRLISRGEQVGPVTLVQVTPDGRYVIAGVLKDTILVFDATTGQELKRWRALDRIVALVADNNRVISGDTLGLMSEFRLSEMDQEWRPVYQWQGHNSKLSGIAMLSHNPQRPDAGKMVSADRSGKIRLWLAASKIRNTSIPAVPGDFALHANAICWKDTERFIRIHSNRIDSLQIKNGSSEQIFSTEADITCVRYAHETDRLVVGDSRGNVTVVHGENSKTSSLSVWNEQRIEELAIDRTGSKALVLDRRENVAVLDLISHKVLLQLSNRESSTISPDGRWIVSADQQTDVFEVLDGNTMQRVTVLDSVDPTYESIAFSDDSQLFVSTGSARTVTVWNTATWSVLHRISCPSVGFRVPAFHPDNRTLAFGDLSGFIRIVDIRAGRELLTLGPFPTSLFRGLGFSPDGDTLGFCDQDWNLHFIEVQR